MKRITKEIYNEIVSLQYNYRYGRTQWHGYNNIWHINWFDGRTSAVKKIKSFGLSKNDVAEILNKRVTRQLLINNTTNSADLLSLPQRISFIKMVNECVFDLDASSSRYNCTGIDWKAFHRPASSGGWVLIAPDEPGNNWHTKDPIIVKYLTKKYLSIIN